MSPRPALRAPRGVSGFRDGSSTARATDVATFRAACHAAARAAFAPPVRAGDVVRAGVTPNFHVLVLSGRDSSLAVLCHATLPLVAVSAAAPVDGAPIHDGALEPGAATEAFTTAGFRVLTPAELATPMAFVDTGELAAAALRQVAYWQPATYGELVFNWWD